MSKVIYPEERLTPVSWQSLSALYRKQIQNTQVFAPEKTTIVVTNWRRPKQLKRCLQSIASIPLPIVVSCSDMSEEVCSVLLEFLDQRPGTSVVAQRNDHGCNEQWLRGVYAAKTPYVLILHDDDELAPQFAAAYAKIIAPELGRVSWVVWDGKVVEAGNLKLEYHRQCNLSTGVHSTDGIVQALLNTKGARSPVVQIFERQLAIRTLKEVEAEFKAPVFFTKPTMVLGNEVLLGLRHASTFPNFLYVNQALTYYGRWEGSETELHVKAGSNALLRGYQAARDYFKANCIAYSNPKPRVIHVTSQFAVHDETLRRHDLAMSTWQHLYDNKGWLSCFVADQELERNGTIVGDPHGVPFVKDLLDAAYRMAAPEDVIVITNSDICVPEEAGNIVLDETLKRGCGFSFRRDATKPLTKPLDLKDIPTLQWYVGSDLFAMAVIWWKSWREDWPDLLIGRPTWDWAMRMLMGYSKEGTTVFDKSLAQMGTQCEIPNVIYHEKHDSWAEVPKNRYGHSIQYCFNTTKDWIVAHGGNIQSDQDWVQEFSWLRRPTLQFKLNRHKQTKRSKNE